MIMGLASWPAPTRRKADSPRSPTSYPAADTAAPQARCSVRRDRRLRRNAKLKLV